MFAQRQFDAETPAVIADITDGVNTGLDSLGQATAELTTAANCNFFASSFA